MRKITYKKVGENYDLKDPIKKLAQDAALRTSKNLKGSGFSEISTSRGESAYVWKQNDILMALVVEGLGTKNLVADGLTNLTSKKNNYYKTIGYDTVATIINDLISVGARPLVVNAYWAVEDSNWFLDKKRTSDLISGWESACNDSGASWGGGETPTLKGIIQKNTIDLGGSAVGIIKNPKKLITESKIKIGDRIILLKSNGINANGLSIARAISKKLPEGYDTKINKKYTFGEALLTKTNIYSNVIQELLNQNVDIHYISNITGHGLRKIMRATKDFNYIIDDIYEPTDLFKFLQLHSGLSNYEAYATWNMGQDYAIFVDKKDIKKSLKIIKDMNFIAIDSGYVDTGKKQVTIKSLNIVYSSKSLDIR